MDKANTGEQPVRLYRNKETGEMFTYREMLEEWRERYEGINPVIGIIGIPDMTIYLNDLKEARHYVWNTWRR